MSAVLDRIRPHPHRGDLIAAGAVPLVLAGVLIELRMTQWPLGARFLVIGSIDALVLAMAFLAPLERETPRSYHSVLIVAGLLPLIVALRLLAEILGAHRPPGSGAGAWTFGVQSAAALAAARRLNSSVSTLIAALAGALAVEALVAWVFQPVGIGTFRALALVLAAGFGLGAVALRDRHRRHAVQLVNATGIVSLVLALTFLAQTIAALAVTRLGIVPVLAAGAAGAGAGAGAGFGWKLYLLAVGFGLVAYGAVDYEPGPAYLGVLVLLAFAVLAGVALAGGGSLVGWPLFLLVLGAAGLAIGLRPRQPLPPPPGPSSAAPTVPLRGDRAT